MTRKQEQREKITADLAEYVLREGLAETSTRQLAAAAGVSNRMLLYYFEDKSEVMQLTLMAFAANLGALLGKTLKEDAQLSPGDMFAETSKLLQGKRLQPYMALWMEVMARAGRGQAPYYQIAGDIAAHFLAWIEQRLSTEDPKERKAQAAMIFAMVDGSYLLSSCTPTATNRAARDAMQALLT
eukprot:s1_g1058.t1